MDSPSLTSGEVVNGWGNVSLYTAADDANRVLSDKFSEYMDFRSSGVAAYTRGRKSGVNVVQMTLADDKQTTLLQLPSVLFAMAWSADGSKLAYLEARFRANGNPLPTALCMYHADTGKVRLLGESTSAPGGIDGYFIDRWSLSWAPDGSAISVEDDFQLRVVSPRGEILVSESSGNYARWLPDGRLLFANDPWPAAKWDVLDITSGQTTKVGVSRRAIEPAPSPDGTMIAFTKMKGPEPISEVLNVKTGEVTKIGAHLLTPIWLSPTEIALTRTKPCANDQPISCDIEDVLSKTVGFDVRTLTQSKLQLPSTIELGVGEQGASVRLPG